jgi:hypothetical protein
MELVFGNPIVLENIASNLSFRDYIHFRSVNQRTWHILKKAGPLSKKSSTLHWTNSDYRYCATFRRRSEFSLVKFNLPNLPKLCRRRFVLMIYLGKHDQINYLSKLFEGLLRINRESGVSKIYIERQYNTNFDDFRLTDTDTPLFRFIKINGKTLTMNDIKSEFTKKGIQLEHIPSYQGPSMALPMWFELNELKNCQIKYQL